MRRNPWIAVAAGLAGITLGAGAGVVAGAAVDDDTATVRGRMMTTGAMGAMSAMSEYESMDAMHAAMRDSMPAEVAEQCDQMHAAMPEGMRSTAPGTMGDMGSMGSMMNGMGGADAGPMADRHAEHHR